MILSSASPLGVALSVAAAVEDMAEGNPGLTRGMLVQVGLKVGRDMLSTSSNMLFLAYLGGFLPVALTFGAQGLSGVRLVHQEALAAFAVTLCVGLMGLVLVVPLTTAIAVMLQPKKA